MIEIRRAIPEDKARIIEISSKIWDGDDYLPHIFDKWVKDTEGEFSVVTVEGVVAGCSKITRLPHNVLWFEGIRVDSDYRGQGLGKKMAEYQLRRAKELGYDRLELGTFVENYESIAIIEKRGFERVAELKFLFKELDESSLKEGVKKPNEDILKIKDLSEVRNIIEKLNTPCRNGYVSMDWTFVKCDEDFLAHLIERDAVYKIKDTVFAFSNWNQKDDGMTVHFIIGNHQQEALDYIIDQALIAKASNIVLMSSGALEERELFIKNGFISITESERDAYVYRLKQGKGATHVKSKCN